MIPGLETLVDDILIQILELLSVRDILSIRQTSWRFEALSRLRNVWYNVLCRGVIEGGMCISGHLTSLASLTSDELEGRVKQALQLERNWSDSKPGMSNMFRLLPGKDILQVIILPGGRYVLTLHDEELLCWDIGDATNSPSNRCVGKWNTPSAGCHVILDASDRYSGNLALGGPPVFNGLNCTILNVDPNIEGNAFAMVGEVPNARGPVVGLHGSIVSCECIDDNIGHIGIELFKWASQEASSLVLERPHQGFGGYLGMYFYAERVVVVWQRFIGIYVIDDLFNAPEPEYINPITVFELARGIQHPISFTYCQPRIPHILQQNTANVIQQERVFPPPLTILARPGDRMAGLTHLVLKTIIHPNESQGSVSFSLIRFPVRAEGICVALYAGPSGRGVRLEEDGGLYRCKPTPMISPYGLVDATVDFYPNSKVDLKQNAGLSPNSSPLIQFDDGTGRLAIGSGSVLTIMDFATRNTDTSCISQQKTTREALFARSP